MTVLNMDTLRTNVIAKGWTSFAVGLIVLLPDIGHAAGAGRFEFVTGDTKVISASGLERLPVKGQSFDAGDTVSIKEGRVQLRFTDGAFVSLAPHSRFHVKEYSYSGVSDGTERVTMELIRGALRTITGLIGKKRKEAYVMQTSLATLGIRGTEYSISYGKGIAGSVSGGAIVVCNAGGCTDVLKGQSYFVRDANTKPVLTEKAAMLPPPQPTREGPSIARSSTQNEDEEDVDTLSGGGGGIEGKGKEKSAKSDAKEKSNVNRNGRGQSLSAEVSRAQEETKQKKEKASNEDHVKAELTSSRNKQAAGPTLTLPLDKAGESGVNSKGAIDPGIDKSEVAASDFKSFTSMGAELQNRNSDTPAGGLGNNATQQLDGGAGNSVGQASQSPDQANTKAVGTSAVDIGLASIVDETGKVKKIKLDDLVLDGKKALKVK